MQTTNLLDNSVLYLDNADFSNEELELIRKLEQCSSILEACRVIGIEHPEKKNVIYYKRKLLEITKKLNIDIIAIIENNSARSKYERNPKYCLTCGKKLPYEKRNGKFCNSSCAATYTNKQKGHRSEETKKKIAESVNRYNDTIHNKKISQGFIEIKEAIKRGLIDNPYNVTVFRNRYIKLSRINNVVCKICGKQFKPHINKSGFVSIPTICNSEECKHILLYNAGKKAYKTTVERGTWKPWQSRSKVNPSYAENFWIKVLNDNSISFEREYSFGGYFLDFFIQKDNVFIDLEIDGHQHSYEDRKEHDKIRDEYMKEHNIIVYRIPWNAINTERGKLKMKGKIDAFLEFYKNISSL